MTAEVSAVDEVYDAFREAVTMTPKQLEHAKWTSSLKNWGHDPLE